jgi:hypothetical protein
VVTLTSDTVPGTPFTTTLSTGRFQFASLPPGTYDATFTLSGFATVRHTGVVVGLGAPTEIDAVLTVGAMTDQVTVKGDSPVINATSAQVGGVLSSEWLHSAPTNRSYHELLRMGPGVNVGTSTAPVAFTVLGSGVNDNAFQLDGADQSTSHSANTAPAVFPNPEILRPVDSSSKAITSH